MEGRRDGRNRGRNLGGRGARGPGVDSAAVQLNGARGEDPWEKWFGLENLPVEVRALTHLEGELGSSLLFEHDGGQSANPLWVVRILLERLFRERLAFGLVVEVFAKHYRREAMRGMVKLQDLVDLVKPPLGGSSIAIASGQPKGEAMELDDDDEEQEEDISGV